MRSLFAMLVLLSLGLTSVHAEESTPANVLPNVPLVTQSTEYSCGAAALLSVLEYYGIDQTKDHRDLREDLLIKSLGTNSETGTEFEALVKTASELGLIANYRTDATWNDLLAHLKLKQLAVVSFQAWPDQPPTQPYRDIWDAGHYSVVIGMDNDKIYFMDPWPVGSHSFLKKSDFLERWHDLGSKNEKLSNPVIFFEGKPHAPSPWIEMP